MSKSLAASVLLPPVLCNAAIIAFFSVSSTIAFNVLSSSQLLPSNQKQDLDGVSLLHFR